MHAATRNPKPANRAKLAAVLSSSTFTWNQNNTNVYACMHTHTENILLQEQKVKQALRHWANKAMHRNTPSN